MRTWTGIFGAVATITLAGACTVTVGPGNGDDLDFSDKSEAPETTETLSTSETQSTSEQAATTDVGSSSTPLTSDASQPGDSTVESQTSTEASTTGAASSSSGTTGPAPSLCNAQPDAGSCEECVALSCEAEWQTCCATDGCVETWMAIYSCVVENPTDNPWDDFDQCAAGASDTGDELDLPVEVQDLYSCVNAPFMGDPQNDPLGRVDGDGTCTLACYNIISLD